MTPVAAPGRRPIICLRDEADFAQGSFQIGGGRCYAFARKIMRPKFWKLSHGALIFSYGQVLEGLSERLVYVHKDTPAKGNAQHAQGEDFVLAPIGDYFYLTHGNKGIYVLGQLSGPANFFSKMGDGWLNRPYRPIKSTISRDAYCGPDKWWAPNHDSTFTPVPDDELPLFEEHILRPYFDIKLSKFGIT